MLSLLKFKLKMLIKLDSSIKNYECEVVFLTTIQENDFASLYNFDKKLASVVLVNNNNNLQLLVGLGDKKIGIKECEKVLAKISTTLNANNIKGVFLPPITNFPLADFIKSSSKIFISADYKIAKVGLKVEKNSLIEVGLNCENNCENTNNLTKGMAIANGMNLCKDLADKPSNICTPTYLADIAKNMASEFNLECEILEEAMLRFLKNTMRANAQKSGRFRCFKRERYLF